jgi:DNA-binding transcriptional ArsR family regulator
VEVVAGADRRTLDVFAAVAEPIRRRMLSILAQGERSAGELGVAFPQLTQPAISRHLRVLREARLVEARPQKQLRIYSLRPEKLRELDQWLSRYRPLWLDRLDSLEEHLDRKRAASERGGL